MNNYTLVYEKIKNNSNYSKKNKTIWKRRKELLDVLDKILKNHSVQHSCRSCGIQRRYFYFWIKRFIESNYDIRSLEGHSKVPKTSPNKKEEAIIEKAIQVRGKTAIGAHKVAYILKRDYDINITGSTLGKYFKKRGISKTIKIKHQKLHTIRYEKTKPLETVQMDTVQTIFYDNNNNKVCLVTMIDDYSRLVYVHVCNEKTSDQVVHATNNFLSLIGKPEEIQTDNGSEFTNLYTSRLNRRRLYRNGSYGYFETLLKENNKTVVK